MPLFDYLLLVSESWINTEPTAWDGLTDVASSRHTAAHFPPSHFYQLWTFTATGRTWCIAESGLLGFFLNAQHPFDWQVQASVLFCFLNLSILQCAFWFWLPFRRQNHLWKMGWWISADYVFPGFETSIRPTCYCTLCHCALLSFHSTLNFSPSDAHSRCQMFCVCTVCTVCVWRHFLLLAAASLVQSQSLQL